MENSMTGSICASDSISSSFSSFLSSSSWTFDQNKRFEQALAQFNLDDFEEEDDDFLAKPGGATVMYRQQNDASVSHSSCWEKIASMVPGKSMADIKKHYSLLLQDLASIEAGRVSLPAYTSNGIGNGNSLPVSPASATAVNNSTNSFNPSKRNGGSASSSYHYGRPPSGSKSSEERKKGIPWTEEEHRLFLVGLTKYGKGDWRSISRNYVVSRTPTQVASHAQKYFIRMNSANSSKDKSRRSSIHDITSPCAPSRAVIHPSAMSNSIPSPSTSPSTSNAPPTIPTSSLSTSSKEPLLPSPPSTSSPETNVGTNPVIMTSNFHSLSSPTNPIPCSQNMPSIARPPLYMPPPPLPPLPPHLGFQPLQTSAHMFPPRRIQPQHLHSTITPHIAFSDQSSMNHHHRTHYQ